MISKDITKKITRIFFSFLFVFLVSFFVLPADNVLAAVCDGVAVEVPEDCDGGNFWLGDDCDSIPGGFDGGVLGCTGVCTFDTSGCCTRNDPTVTIAPASLSGLAGQAQTYVLSVKNNDSAVCANRTFVLSLSGLTPCVPGWNIVIDNNTGSLASGLTYNIALAGNVVISSCASSAPGADTFTITATEGANSGNDTADYVITASPVEDCTDVTLIDEDGDGDANCLDLDCVGVAPCCGDNNVTGFEACDINGNLGCVGSEICAGCNSCISSSTAGECPVGFDDCDCDGTCEMNVLSDPFNCGKCGNVCPGNYCNNGTCIPVTGGLVPCGRMYDNSDTVWNEQESCKICHVVPLAKNVINYLVSIVGLITVLFIIIGGLMSITSAGGSAALSLAKTATTKSLYGFVFVLVAWAIVNVGMVIFGFDDPLGDGSWSKIDCDLIISPINHYCGDGIIDNPNSDGIAEICDPMELKIDFITRTGLGAEEWVETIYACDPIICDFGCALDPLVGQIGEGCYQPFLADGLPGTVCQKGRYICDFNTDTVICQNTYNDSNYRLAGSYCADIFDECCVDGGAALPAMTFDIIRLPTNNITSCGDWDCYAPGCAWANCNGVCTCPAGYSCDDICKQNGGKVCVGVGLMDVSAFHCISLKDNFGSAPCSGDYQCNNSANLLTNDCRAEFYTTIWTCDECSDVSPIDGINEAYDFSVGETACYCK